LSEEFIGTLETEEQKEIAHQINRRTEFRVLRTDYEPGK
jgi:peptidoglycan-associated lipoprotein